MAFIKSFRELEVYKLALQEARKIFVITKAFPRDEVYSMSSQIRRSSRAVTAMLAESWARRIYPAAFVSKLNEALGEAMETQAWLDNALNCGYIDSKLHSELDNEWQHIGAMLNKMIQKPEGFCQSASKG